MKRNKRNTEELFKKICTSEFKKLRKDENLIFENLNFTFDWDKEYEKFKNSDDYLKVLHENSDYEKMKKLQSYFNEKIIFPIIEGMYLKADDLPITSDILLENTYNVLLDKVKKKVNKELVEELENSYLSLNEDKRLEILEEFNYLNKAKRIGSKISAGIVNTGRFAKKVAMDVVLIIESIKYILNAFLYLPSKLPFMDQFYQFLFELDNPLKKVIKKELSILTVERPELKDFFESELNTNLKTIIKNCWDNNMKTININSNFFMESHPQVYRYYMMIKTFFYKNFLKPDDIKIDSIKSDLLKEIKTDKTFNHMISNYRLCLYDNIIDYLQSYAQVSFDIGDVENKLIKKLNNIKNQRNPGTILKDYKEFFNLRPKNKAEQVFIISVSNLIYLKEMFFMTKKDISDFDFYDRYIRKDVDVLIKKVDQAMQNILDAYNSSSRPQQKQYEETLRDNKEKKLVGNEPTETKKISVFDI